MVLRPSERRSSGRLYLWVFAEELTTRRGLSGEFRVLLAGFSRPHAARY